MRPAVHTTCGTIFVAVSLLLVDRFGRRTLFRKSTPSLRSHRSAKADANSHWLCHDGFDRPGRGALAVEVRRYY